MKRDHLLDLNPRKVIRCLRPIISADQLDAIETALRQNVGQLIRLAQAHLRYAKASAGSSGWRQRVSRGYYCTYTASRAVRLEVDGTFSTDASDHKKIGELPKDFNNVARWADFLTKFRADRNLADYDHTAQETELELRSRAYLSKAEEFLNETKKYLRNRGAL
jgi:uncharacterized protein (UPF0332 family)